MSLLVVDKKMNNRVEINKIISAKAANMSFVCALLVVMIHSTTFAKEGSSLWWFMSIGRDFICKIGVPFFFVASGYFLAARWQEPSWYSRAILKRIRTLMVPFAIFAVCWFFYSGLIQMGVQIIKGEDFCPWQCFTISGVIKASGVNLLSLPQLGPLWYLRCLFLLVCISPIFFCLHMAGKWFYILYLCSIFILGGIIRAFHVGPQFFWLCGLSAAGLFYFPIGIFIRLNALERIRFSGITVGVCGFVSLVLICSFLAMKLAHWPYCDCFVWSSILPLMIVAWHYMPTESWPLWLVSNTFPIYLLHKFIIAIEARVFVRSNIYDTSVILHLAIFALVVVCSIALAVFLRKFTPRLSKIIFGGR